MRAQLASMPITFRADGGGDVKRIRTRQATPGDTLRILCYGDSLTAGFFASGNLFEPYGRTLSEVLNGAGFASEVSVCGLNGLTAGEMVAAMDENKVADVVGFCGKGLRHILDEEMDDVDLVILMAGTNDLGKGSSANQILEQVKALHLLCHDRGVRTVLVTPPPAPFADATRECERGRLVRLLSDWAQDQLGVASCVDSADILPVSGSALWDPDGLHFSVEGSRTLGRQLADVAMAALLQDEDRALPRRKGSTQLADVQPTPIAALRGLPSGEPAIGLSAPVSFATPTVQASVVPSKVIRVPKIVSQPRQAFTPAVVRSVGTPQRMRRFQFDKVNCKATVKCVSPLTCRMAFVVIPQQPGVPLSWTRAVKMDGHAALVLVA